MTALLLAVTLAISLEEFDGLTAYHQGLILRADAVAARPHFRRAAVQFDAQWDEPASRSPGLARRRGQAWHLAGDVGRGIAAYRDGLRLYPADEGLLTRLEFTRGQVALPRDGELAEACRPLPPPAMLPVPPVAVFSGLIVVNLVGGIWLARWRLTHSRGALATGAVCFLGSWASAWGWHESTERAARHWAEPTAVVAEPATLRTGNNAEYPAMFSQPIPAGVEVTPLGERGGWLRVRLPGGRAGWLPAEVYVPSAAREASRERQ